MPKLVRALRPIHADDGLCRRGINPEIWRLSAADIGKPSFGVALDVTLVFADLGVGDQARRPGHHVDVPAGAPTSGSDFRFGGLPGFAVEHLFSQGRSD